MNLQVCKYVFAVGQQFFLIFFSGPDLNDRAKWHQLVNLLNFVVGNGNTPLCPVNLGMKVTNPRHPILYAMDHDISTRSFTRFFF